MCIVCVFPKGIDKTTAEVKQAIESGLSTNDHSAGFALRRAGESEIYIKKGYVRKVTDIYKDIMGLKPGIDDVLIVHGRIATHGGNTAELAHPFVCSEDLDEVLTTEGKVTKPILAHNGVFRGLGDRGLLANNSDTSDFAHKIAGSKLFQTALFRNPKKVERLLDSAPYNILSWSKVVFLYPIADTEPVYIGTGWKTVDNLGVFSNEGYSRKVYDFGGSSSNPHLALQSTSKSGVNNNICGVTNKSLVGPQTEINRNEEDSNDEIFFRYDSYGVCSTFSNSTFRVNVYNYPFLNFRVDKVIYNKMIANNNYRKSYGVTTSDLKLLNSLLFFVNYKIMSFSDEDCFIKYDSTNNMLNVNRVNVSNVDKNVFVETPIRLLESVFIIEPKWAKRSRVDQLTGEIITDSVSNMALSNFIVSYNALRRLSLFNKDGTISLSYTKKLYNIVEDNIYICKDEEFIRAFNSKSHSNRKGVIIKNNCRSLFMLGENLIKKITSNTNVLLYDVSPLALALFLLERSTNLTKFQEESIKEAISSFAFLNQLIKSDFMFYTPYNVETSNLDFTRNSSKANPKEYNPKEVPILLN